METTEKKLTARQRRFVDLYLQLGNACEAAERAGFKRSYAAGAMRQSAVKASEIPNAASSQASV